MSFVSDHAKPRKKLLSPTKVKRVGSNMRERERTEDPGWCLAMGPRRWGFCLRYAAKSSLTVLAFKLVGSEAVSSVSGVSQLVSGLFGKTRCRRVGPRTGVTVAIVVPRSSNTIDSSVGPLTLFLPEQ